MSNYRTTSNPEEQVKYINPADCKYLMVDAGVRYWEDGDLNGKPDEPENGEDINDYVPKMPFAVRTGEGRSIIYRWKIIIDLDTMKIVGWPNGNTADIHYKVCDDGNYKLASKYNNILCEKDCYVPHILQYADDCMDGDYIVMHIGEDGELLDFPMELRDDYIAQLINIEGFNDYR